MNTRTSSRNIIVSVFAVVLSLAVIGCKKDSVPEETTAEVVEPVLAQIEISPQRVTPGAIVEIELPGDWHAHDFFSATWLPGDDAFSVSLEADTGCAGACDADQMASSIAAETEAPLEGRWSQGSDEPHFQPIVEVLDAGELPLGRYRAYRLSYPPAPDGEAVAMPGTHLECYLNNPGDPFFVVLDATARPEHEEQIWPALLDSCRGATYTATE